MVPLLMALLARVQSELEVLQWGLIDLQCKVHDMCATTVYRFASAAVRAEAGEADRVQLVAIRAARMIADAKDHPAYLFNPHCILLQMTSKEWLGAVDLMKILSSAPCTVQGLSAMLAVLPSLGLGVAIVRPGQPMVGYYDELPGLRAALYGGSLPAVPQLEVLFLPPLSPACFDPPSCRSTSLGFSPSCGVLCFRFTAILRGSAPCLDARPGNCSWLASPRGGAISGWIFRPPPYGA